jgi:dTDP-4-dehydrorhamnose 3,5-epimerase-like enzyme
MSLVKLIDFESLGDERGELVSLEQNANIPFEIKRVYYMWGTNSGVSRGFHAHKDLKQVAICLSGSCKFFIKNGVTSQEYILDSPKIGLLIDSMVWREMHDFSENCVLMVIASNQYDEDDYIRDYDEFLEYVKNDT